MDSFDACTARRPKLSFKPCWEEAAQTCNNRLCLSRWLFKSSPHGRQECDYPRHCQGAVPYLVCGGAACLSPQGCPSGPFPASSFTPDLFNFDAVIVAGHCWPGEREVLADSSRVRGFGCSQRWELLVLSRWEQQHSGGICSGKEKTLHKKGGFWATVFSQGENTSRCDFVG